MQCFLNFWVAGVNCSIGFLNIFLLLLVAGGEALCGIFLKNLF